MKINATLNRLNTDITSTEYTVDNVIELSEKDFNSFSSDLLADRQFISDANRKFGDEHGCNYCMLVLGENNDDGILVESEGYDYARYSAHIPNARQIYEQSKIPSILKRFSSDIINKVDEIIKRAIENNENGSYTIEYTDLEEEIMDDLSTVDLIEKMLTARDEVLENAGDTEEITLVFKPQYTNYTSEYEPDHFDYDNSYQNEIELLCARHLLWIHSSNSEGHQADFTDCTFRNIDFSHKNLCGAIFKGAEFINCTFDDASMCFANFESTKFKDCSLKHFGADEATFKNAEFYKCDLKGAYFTHSNFTDSAFNDCYTFETDFTNCCLDSWTCEDCNLDYTFFGGVSYSEHEWVREEYENEDEDNSIIMGGM